MRLRQPRCEPLGDDELSPRQAEVLAALGAARGRLNIFRTAVLAPDALAALLGVGGYIGSDRLGLSPRQREIVILRIGFACKAGYEWAQHVRIGARAGLTPAEIEAVKTGPQSSDWIPAERALLAACDELRENQFIGEDAWCALGEFLSDRQRLDLIVVAGHYLQVCMILNTLGVQLEDGQALDPDLTRFPDA
jgi:alkylhydroperoxidase family enzyme